MSLQTYLDSPEYAERVYAGVLGKIIGVYLGRPFEGWSNERIERELGEIDYYVHEKLNAQLVVTDDDISGTFTFLRTLSENGCDPNLTAAQIGDWWLNTIIQDKSILWWGGMGMSTEHTAYLNLKHGLRAPESGSIAANGAAVAEEIGAQIFIDGWGLISPGDPAQAADFARRAASVSHDGEAIYGAQVVAALVAQAFVETDLGRMLDTAASLIPADCLIAQTIGDMRIWAASNGNDWRLTLRQLQEKYGYARFGTNCPMVSNHAVVLLGLLHGQGDFGRSLMIANTAGYDTDCNSGNVGCILGVWKGLAGIDSPRDWRGPVADRLFLPTADGGRTITDAVRESGEIVNIARALSGLSPTRPKNGARFHFSLPRSVQGFAIDSAPTKASVRNIDGVLAFQMPQLEPGGQARFATATFLTPETANMGGCTLTASPTLYAGQTVTARVQNFGEAVAVGLYAAVYGADNRLTIRRDAAKPLALQEAVTLIWKVPSTDGQPIAKIGVELTASAISNVDLRLDWLTWNGTPDTVLGYSQEGGDMQLRAWVSAADHFSAGSSLSAYHVIKNEGEALVTQGEWSWSDYTVSADIIPRLSRRSGLAACVRGLRRYVALVLDRDHAIRFIEQRDGTERALAMSDMRWDYGTRHALSLTVSAGGITASVDDSQLTATGTDLPTRGAVGLLIESGRVEFGPVTVRPA